MKACRLLLFGSPKILIDQKAIPIKLRKAVALIAYLAIQHRSLSREFLATLLWPDQGQQKSLANLRRTLSALRTSLSVDCFVVEGDQIRLNSSLVNVDVDEFRMLSSPDSSPDYACLEEAVRLYRGCFMEGFSLGKCVEYDEWQDSVRETLALELDTVLQRLSEGYLRSGKPGKALPFAHGRLDLDNLNESAHRMLMQIYALSGRNDLAYKQYEACTRVLSVEGFDPEESTVELFRAIREHHLTLDTESAGTVTDTDGSEATVLADNPNRKRNRLPARRHRLRLIMIGVVILIVAATSFIPLLQRIFTVSDVEITSLELIQRGNELEGILVSFRNNGPIENKVRFSIFFTGKQYSEVGQYVAFSDEIKIKNSSEKSVKIDCLSDIQPYSIRSDADIPHGLYTVSAAVISTRARDKNPINNILEIDEWFFYRGVEVSPVFEIEIDYNSELPLNNANPLIILIGDRTPGEEERAQLRVTAPGLYFIPEQALQRPDTDGSGYFLVCIYDANDNLGRSLMIEHGDIQALYKEVEGNLVYGPFNCAKGMPIYPDIRYSVNFKPPPEPKPDEYELDDFLELGTEIVYNELPIRQFHTFHMDEGDFDYDWFHIYIPDGHPLVIETFSAGELWESNTSIDFNSSEGYINGNTNKESSDNYSIFSYINNTGRGQIYYIAVKPRIIPSDIRIKKIGEYIVEFRKF